MEEEKALEMPIHELASTFVREQGLPMEEEIRQRILRKQELKMRTRVFLIFKNFKIKLILIDNE